MTKGERGSGQAVTCKEAAFELGEEFPWKGQEQRRQLWPQGSAARKPVQPAFFGKKDLVRRGGRAGGWSASEALEFDSHGTFRPWLGHTQLCGLGQSLTSWYLNLWNLWETDLMFTSAFYIRYDN